MGDSMSTLVVDAFAFDMTVAGMKALRLDPIVAGDYRRLRLQYRRLQEGVDNPIPINGRVIFSIRSKDAADFGTLLFRRDSEDPIVGWGDDPFQIVADDDQTVETADSGRGWYAIIFTPPDEVAMAALAGRRMHYDVRLMPGDVHEKTLLRGDIEILSPDTETEAFT
jgi:hypothetical protein